jgi:hypothetical protein
MIIKMRTKKFRELYWQGGKKFGNVLAERKNRELFCQREKKFGNFIGRDKKFGNFLALRFVDENQVAECQVTERQMVVL